MNDGRILAFIDMDMRPDIFPFPHHAGLASSQTDFDESGDLLRMDVLNAEINEFARGDAIDRRGQYNISLYVTY